MRQTVRIMVMSVTKPVRRAVEGVERGRDVILTVYPGGVLGFRVKRCRKEYGTIVRIRVTIELTNQAGGPKLQPAEAVSPR